MIKKFLQSLKDSFKLYITNHLGTNILLLIISLVILVIDLDDPSTFVQRLIVTLFLTAMFTVLGEVYTKENKKRYIIYFIGLVFSIFISKCFVETILIRYLIGVICLIGSTILYIMANNSKDSTPKFLTSTFTNLFKYGIIGSILNMGLLSILALISILLFEIEEMVFLKLEIVLLVLYYIPALIISLENKEEENKFIYILINYVSLPLITIATLVIYIYLIKLLVTLKLPHTSTFAINAILLILGIPIVLMTLSYDDGKLPNKVANVLRLLFIPLIPLQIFSLSLRIADYSITATRYFGIVLIILGIVSLILLNKNKGDKFKFILLPCMILSITSFVIPYINIFELPNYMQINRLKEILPEGKSFESLSNKEVDNVRSIYYYVSDKKYYPDYLSKKEVERLLFNYNEYGEINDDYIYYSNKNRRINVLDYKEVEYYTFSNYDGFKLLVNDETYDIKGFCKKLSSYNKKSDIDNYINENLPIKLDDNTYLYILELDLNYNSKYFNIEGYILYK